MNHASDFTRPTPTPTTPGKCTGKTYTIKSGDTCRSISKAENIATSWLLADNGLKAFCAEFPTTGDLCIQNTCSTYTVQKGDTCLDIAKANRISQVQLYTCTSVHSMWRRRPLQKHQNQLTKLPLVIREPSPWISLQQDRKVRRRHHLCNSTR